MESQKVKKEMSGKKKALLIIVAVILVLLIAVGIVVYAVGHGFYHASNYIPDEEAMKDYSIGSAMDEELLNPEDAIGKVLTEREQQELEKELDDMSDMPINDSKNVYNVLLIGVDRRDKSWAGNSDVMILMSVNYDKKQVSMISLMRDTYVNIPGIGMRKLNAAHANGAGPLLLKTVSENFKIRVDRYATVDFESMADIVDELGGIELKLSAKEAEHVNSNVRYMCGKRGIDPEPYLVPGEGTWHCGGMAAVGYARIRKIGNADFQRTERQRIVLSKMIDKARTMSVTELYDFAQEVLPLVTHNIPESEMWSMISKAPSLLQYNLVKDRVPYDKLYKAAYINKRDVLAPDWEPTLKKLKETLY